MTLKLNKEKKLRILHITNFNERHNGRLFFNTGRRLNNGFIRLGHSVLEFSDRDIVSYYRNFNDFDGSKKLSRFSKPSVISPTPFAFKDKILQPISSQIGFKLSISDLSQMRKDGFESFIK